MKIKAAHYRQDRPLRLQEPEAPTISRQSAQKMACLSVLQTGRLYPQEIPLVIISVRD